VTIREMVEELLEMDGDMTAEEAEVVEIDAAEVPA